MDEFAPSEEQPTGERWDPLGAPNEDAEAQASNNSILEADCCSSHCFILEKFKSLEEEQDLLSSSLFALTTHFAQVQFRLKQIVDASIDDKDELLRSLEEFAFRGIPDVGSVKERISEANLAEMIRLRRTQQQELIEKLKSQLHELEQYAFESGEADVPQDVVLERQRVILNELKIRINLQLDEQKLHQLTTADVKQQIDIALSNLINPLKVKEHLVSQLKTQVDDLERFINYLQADTKKDKCVCGCALHTVQKPNSHESTLGLVQRTATLLHMFALLQLGCGPSKFKRNDLKTTNKINHYGDIRARLELSILKVKELASHCDGNGNAEDYISDSDSGPSSLNSQLITAVRKHFATCLRDLMEHGAVEANHTHSIVPFSGCFSRRPKMQDNPVHAWEIIVNYYELKNGERFNSTPARRLSQSFNLDIAGASASSTNQNMLCVISNIVATHSQYKRSYDSHFKAFICAALNANKLVTWLSLIYQCRQLINMHYLEWSYVVKTGFQDALQSLDSLSKFKFNLPVDLAIRQFQNIKDVFT
ncbi:RUN domain-containing protein 1 [Onthophagus taurus]|uniref:RUN domain-containing protein 1 n=1 Tax=Onthophagus taurus TaxID=166361 RepID=UPI0039BDC99E